MNFGHFALVYIAGLFGGLSLSAHTPWMAVAYLSGHAVSGLLLVCWMAYLERKERRDERST